MANIKMLKEYAETEASIYAAFKATRIEDRNQLQKPFDQLSPNEVTPTLLKWLCEREGRRVTVQLRIHNPSCAIMHYVGIKAHRQHIYTLYVLLYTICLQVVNKQHMCGNRQPRSQI